MITLVRVTHIGVGVSSEDKQIFARIAQGFIDIYKAAHDADTCSAFARVDARENRNQDPSERRAELRRASLATMRDAS